MFVLTQPNILALGNHNKGFSRPRHVQGRGAKLACVDKLGVFLSLALCNKATFDPLQQVLYDDL